jgi:hypothetical protein
LHIVGTLQFDNESEKYLFTVALRPETHPHPRNPWHSDNSHSHAAGLVPKTKLRVRLDGGFANPEIFDYLEVDEVEYLVAMAGNVSF